VRDYAHRRDGAEREALLRTATDGSGLEVYILRPCIVAGPKATALADSMPWRQFRQQLPAVLRPAASLIEGMLPLLPDPGVVMQLVHHDDVAAAIALAVTGAGLPGAYNLAGDGELSLREVAEATGTRSIRVPHAAAVTASRVVASLPMLPAAAEWVHVARASVVMDTSRAKNELGWRPQYTSRETLSALAEVL
jgi:UDP-glucose 4-epimerase